MIVPDPFNPWVAWYLARFINLARYRAGIASLYEHSEQVFGRRATIHLYPRGGMSPETIIAEVPGKVVITIGGLPSTESADRIIGGYFERPDLRAPMGANRALLVSSDRVEERIASAGVSNWDDVYIAGYSYGGAVAFVLAAVLRQLHPASTITVVTFGGPKPGDYRLTNFMAPAGVARYMNLRDPVPLIPPQAFESVGEIDYTNLLSLGNSREFVHIGTGVMLTEDTSYQVANTGAILPEGFSLATIGWFSGMMYEPSTEHQIVTYESRLYREKAIIPEPTIATAALGPLLPRRGGEPPAIPSQVIPPEDMRAGPPAGNATQHFLPPTAELPASPVWTLQRGRVQTKGPYYHEKLGKKYYVSAGGSQLFQTRTRRDARRSAARLNRLIVLFDRATYKNELAFEQSVRENFGDQN